MRQKREEAHMTNVRLSGQAPSAELERSRYLELARAAFLGFVVRFECKQIRNRLVQAA